MTGPRIEPSFFESIFGLQPQQSAPPPPQPSPTDRLFQALSGINAAIRQAMVPSGLAQLESGAKQFGEQQGYQFEAQRAQAGYAKSHPQSLRARQEMMNNAVMVALGMGLPPEVGATNRAKFLEGSTVKDVVYHQTSKANVPSIERRGFDLNRVGARGSDEGVPDGIFMKPSDNDIGVGASEKGGNAQIPLYAAIRKPLVVKDRVELSRILGADKEYASLEARVRQRDLELAGAYDKMEAEAKAGEWGSDRNKRSGFSDEFFAEAEKLFERGNKEMRELAAAARARATALIRQMGHDGLIINEDAGSFNRKTKTIVALEPTQVKHATKNTGGFDPKQASILASLLVMLGLGNQQDRK